MDVWDAAAVHGGTHVSEPERAAFRALLDLGLTDAYRSQRSEPGRFTWWDYRAGMFHKNFGMRIDHLLVSAPVASRLVGAEIDREARKGPPVPSDHAPLVIDLDEPGKPFDPDWEGALARIQARTKPEVGRTRRSRSRCAAVPAKARRAPERAHLKVRERGAQAQRTPAPSRGVPNSPCSRSCVSGSSR